MLEHPDRADRVERTVANVAIVLVPDLDAVGKSRIGDRLLGPLGLAARERHADRSNAVVRRGVQDHPAPPAAHVEQPHPRLEPELAAHELVLLGLRVLERDVRAGRSHTAHEYVIEADRAPSGRRRSRRRSGARSRPRPVPRVADAAEAGLGRDRGRRPVRASDEPARPSTSAHCRAPNARRSGIRSRSAASAAYRSPSTSSSPETYARPSPSSPGAVTRRRNTSGERTRSVAGASAGPSRLPSYARTAIGRSGPRTASRARATVTVPGYGGCRLPAGSFSAFAVARGREQDLRDEVRAHTSFSRSARGSSPWPGT